MTKAADPVPRSRYPTRAAIARMVEAARAAGIDVGGIEAQPDGAIRVLGRDTARRHPRDEFEAWDQRGQL